MRFGSIELAKDFKKYFEEARKEPTVAPPFNRLCLLQPPKSEDRHRRKERAGAMTRAKGQANIMARANAEANVSVEVEVEVELASFVASMATGLTSAQRKRIGCLQTRRSRKVQKSRIVSD